MENTKIIFCSSDMSEVQTELECFCNNRNEIYIGINDPTVEYVYANQFVALTKETAIKFSKHLRKEIAILMENQRQGGFNG